MKNIILGFVLFFTLILFAKVSLSQSNTSTIQISDSLDAYHYTIQVHDINTADHTIDATTIVTMIARFDDVHNVQLQLKDLTVTSVSIDGVFIPGYTYIDGLITIPLPTLLNTNDTADVEVSYNGTPYHESWGGFHFSGDYAFNLGVGISDIPHNLGKTWFPCIDNFTDRATYLLEVTVDTALTAVCGGLLQDITFPSPGKKTFHWYLSQPIPTYLASVATGDYALVEHTYNGLAADIPITFYVRPSQVGSVNGCFVNFDTIMMILETHFGAYAWDRMGYVGTAIGAMEHATNVAFPNSSISSSLSSESLYTHELFHMWFGDKVTCDKAEEMWINEGWGTYASWFYLEILYDEALFKEELINTHAYVLQNVHVQEGAYLPLNNIPQEYTYGTSAYDKGATVVQSLRNYLGDNIFFPAMTHFLDSLAFTSVSSYDMRDVLTDYTGIDMAGFFDNWVFNGGTPHYGIDSFNIQTTSDNSEVTIYLRQKRKGPPFVGNLNRTDVYFMDADWEFQVEQVEFSGETGTVVVPLTFEPIAMFLNLEHNLCDATTFDSKVINQTGEHNYSKTYFLLDVEQVIDSAFVRAVHNWVPPDSLKTPVPDLRISDYRFWTIEGVFPDNFVATGRFQYNKSGNLDNTLILSETDSIVILYRENISEDWESIPFTRLGPWSIGYLYVDSLKAGEYTLAVIDIQVGQDEFNEELNDGSRLHVFPNPSNGLFNIQYKIEEDGFLWLSDLNGKIFEKIPVAAKGNNITWEPDAITGGTYFLSIKNANNQIIASEKIIVIK